MKKIIDTIEQNCKIIKNLTSNQLRDLASHDETTTEFGSAKYITKIKSRSAKFTEIIIDEPNEKQQKIIDEVNEYIKEKELICVDRNLCNNPKMELKCRSYYSKEYARIGYMWYNSLFDPKKGNPNQTVVQIPEWKERKILVDAKNNITLILGSDYFGECKKAHLRMGMYYIKQKGGLGLHAGSKIIKIKNHDGKIIEKGIILFGLSGTGKTTLTVHDYDLKSPESVIIRQDDVILMDSNGYCYGTENGFFIKTEGLTKDQKVLYNAATKPYAILENVFVDNNGKVDFCNYEITTNGRGIIKRTDIDFTDEKIDIKKANIVIFITRRDDIIPPVIKLSPKQGACAFMLGESIETSAGDPEKAGQSKRVVGTNPFIIGSKDEEGNRLLEILKNNPNMQCYILNTGKVGNKDKITIKDSTTIIREIAKNNIKWKICPEWNYYIADKIDGINSKKLNPKKYFSKEEYDKRVEKLKQERIKWLSKFPKLKDEIKNSIKLD